jgi:L-asparaginase
MPDQYGRNHRHDAGLLWICPYAGYMEKTLSEAEDFQHEPLPAYDFLEYDPLLDSSNVTVSDWNKLGRDVADRYEDYDGFVILHGTDTMAYTASALSFMLEGLGKPVILTGSQIPFFEVRSDARQNLITAMMLAADYDIPEVCTYFGGKLMRGNRSTKISSDTLIAFDSPNLDPLAEAGVRITVHEHLLRRQEGPLRLCSLPGGTDCRAEDFPGNPVRNF